MNTEKLLFALLRIALTGTQEEISKEEITPEVLEEVYALAQKHDLAHIAGHGLAKLGVLGNDEISNKFRKHSMVALRRYMLLQNELLRLSGGFGKAQVAFLPLKGSVLRDAYPEGWMRTSCDIDLFVREEDLQTIHTLLTETLQYKLASQWGMVSTYTSPTGVHLEVHYTVLEEMESAATMAVFNQVWDYTYANPKEPYRLLMQDDMFYFYHIAHMAKHFLEGGCGVRPVMDIWVLQHRMSFDNEKRNALLQEGGLLQFAQCMEKLSEYWFAGAEVGGEIRQLERYLLDGGLYGTVDNKVKVQQGKQGGKMQYILSRIFVPYSIMKNNYPILKKHKWLLPFLEVWRWIRAVFTGNISRQEVQSSMQANSEDAMGDMLHHLGLK